MPRPIFVLSPAMVQPAGRRDGPTPVVAGQASEGAMAQRAEAHKAELIDRAN